VLALLAFATAGLGAADTAWIRGRRLFSTRHDKASPAASVSSHPWSGRRLNKITYLIAVWFHVTVRGGLRRALPYPPSSTLGPVRRSSPLI
jgi:hypothetical protein